MKLTQILYKQHMGRFIRRHWFIQSNRTILEDGAEVALKARGIQVLDPLEVIKPKPVHERIEFPKPLRTVTPKNDKTHPDWHDSPSLMYGNNDLLLEGVTQAKLLTKTIQIQEELPERIETLVNNCPNDVNDLVLRSISTSNLFDAHQERLQKVKDPERPAWNYPRLLGITDARKSFNLLHKFLQLCESISGPKVAFTRSFIDRGMVSVPIEKDLDLLYFSLTIDLAVTSASPLKPFAERGLDQEMPNLYPMHHNISLRKENIYQVKDMYPIEWDHPKPHIHTIMIHHDPVEVKNLTELPTRETQVLARNLLKAFSAAASCARRRFGESVKDLPEPVTVQCVQTEGKSFHFSVFQLNTLNINGMEGTKNYWWTSPRLNLYDKAEYFDGKPLIDKYNPEVFKRIFAFYNNN